ncbi:MAG: alpha-glucosidase, partial [Candidatus Accumulibacter sp.]|nr:alpha-glucosidase [Accumulibacter sp.]
QVLAFERIEGSERIIAAFNLSAEPAAWPAALPEKGAVVMAVNDATPGSLPGHGALLYTPD